MILMAHAFSDVVENMSQNQALPNSDRLIVDAMACLGCKTCTLFCSLNHEREFNPSLAFLHVAKNPMNGSYNPEVCNQCMVPACFYACPIEDAIAIDSKTGARVIIEERCIKCGRCLDACLLGMITFNPAKNTYSKCNLCDGNPLCVKYCPTNAIKYKKRR